MYRIFGSLSFFAIALLVAASIIGWVGPDYNGLSARYLQAAAAEKSSDMSAALEGDAALLEEWRAAQRHVRVHILIGILAMISSVLVQCVGVTYFIGTGRWCKEVVETYRLSPDWVQKANQTKRRSFPWAMFGIAVALASGALGAAADPGTLNENTQAWVAPHQWLAVLGTVVIGICLKFQATAIARHQATIEAILADVLEVRKLRGLEIESP